MLTETFPPAKWECNKLWHCLQFTAYNYQLKVYELFKLRSVHFKKRKEILKTHLFLVPLMLFSDFLHNYLVYQAFVIPYYHLSTDRLLWQPHFSLSLIFHYGSACRQGYDLGTKKGESPLKQCSDCRAFDCVIKNVPRSHPKELIKFWVQTAVLVGLHHLKAA